MSTPFPSRASMRKVLMLVLRNDADLTAFCIDYFPGAQGEFTSGMLRTDKLNFLLANFDTDEVLARLREAHGDVLRSYEQFLEYPSYPMAQPAPAIQTVREERTYPIWAEPAEAAVMAALHGLGYTYQTTFNNNLVLVTQPLRDRALIITVSNLMGSTRISVKVIPPGQDSHLFVDRFFQTFEQIVRDGSSSTPNHEAVQPLSIEGKALPSTDSRLHPRR